MQIQHLTRADGNKIAYRQHQGDPEKVGVVWLSGFKSDMDGGKAQSVGAWAQETNRSYTAFDYFGHGHSSGDFEKGTVSRWREDALGVLDEVVKGPVVLIGSSMGGWISMLAALERSRQVQGLVLIAPAPDFTQKLMWPEFTTEQKQQIRDEGRCLRPSDYGEPYPISRELIEDGAKWSLLDGKISLRMPIRILQGMEDPDVPWDHAFRIVNAVGGRDVTFTLIKDGDHRLSRPEDIDLLIGTIGDLTQQLDAVYAHKIDALKRGPEGF